MQMHLVPVASGSAALQTSCELACAGAQAKSAIICDPGLGFPAVLHNFVPGGGIFCKTADCLSACAEQVPSCRRHAQGLKHERALKTLSKRPPLP